jgi:hypothetical protein
MKNLSKARVDLPAEYQIKILGRLGQEWSTTFGNFHLEVELSEEDIPVTILRGEVVDQAYLHSLLQEVRDLGLLLLLVERLPDDE